MLHLFRKYSPGHADLILGNLRIKELMVIFDSGSSYTYFTSRVYGVLLSQVSSNETSDKKAFLVLLYYLLDEAPRFCALR